MAETINTIHNPLISVIVPCYNQAQYLSEALQSLIGQTYPHWECIIIDDGSPDNTEDVANEWLRKDQRFIYFRKKNGGVSDTRNFGIAHSTGEFIIPLDADDKIGPHYFSRAMEVFSAMPETKLVYSNTLLFGNIEKELIKPAFSFPQMLKENQIHNSAIFRKSAFQETDGYNINMVEGLEDWDFYLSLIKPEDKVVKLDDFHYLYRIKDISRSTLIDSIKNEKLLLQIFRNHLPLYLEYFNPIRDHIEATYYKWEANLYKNSIEYKIGDFFLSPVKYIRKVFRRIFSGEKD
ncbi:glycosyltransferase family 2 protein [Dysgonomonas termitidis]|uniref:Glycosyltransferase family 2 protein n=1 Tax=Dysgonomonas termitidis TaxID=1516126 RepID=A0ABV9KSM5_9BACT